MANSMCVTVLYESMSVREVSATELSKAEGYILQDELVDVSNPDDGIFWDRSCIFNYSDEAMKDFYQDKFMRVHERICVVPPNEMTHVLGVWVKGVLTLIRDESATNTCKLKNVFLEQQGITQSPSPQELLAELEEKSAELEEEAGEEITSAEDVAEEFIDDIEEDIELI